MNMVIAELGIASYGLPVDFLASINFGWKGGKELCLATGFLLTTFGKNVLFLDFKDIFYLQLLITYIYLGILSGN